MLFIQADYRLEKAVCRASADFFLEHIDHGQEQAVNLAYEFYRLSKADYFVLSSFLPFLEKDGGFEAETGRGKEHGWGVSRGVHGLDGRKRRRGRFRKIGAAGVPLRKA